MQQGKKLNHAMRNLNVGSLPPAPPRPAPGGDSNIARAGAPKRVSDIPISPGMKHQDGGSVYTGPGQKSVDDEKEPPLKSHQTIAPVAHGMTSKQAAAHGKSPSGNAVLLDASRMAKPAEKA